MDDSAAFEFKPNASRRSRILRLRAHSHPEYPIWRGVFLYGGWISVAVGLFAMPLFGIWWRIETAVWAAFAVSFVLGVIVLCALGFTALTGRFTCWTLVSREDLTLDETVLRYSLTPNSRRPWKREPIKPFIWVMPYQNVTRLDYDRSMKCLRVFGRFDEEASRKPDEKSLRLPRGMTAISKPESRPDKDFYLEVPLYYDDSTELLRLLERRAGVFIHPAIRGDDYADLRDLPGLKPNAPVMRALSLFLVVLCVIALALAADLRGSRRNPWQPYPLTEEDVLTGSFDVGESFLLDGCRVTLESAEPGRDGGLEISLLFSNENDAAILLHLGKQQGNVIASAKTTQGDMPCNYIPPDNPRVQIAPGGVYHYDTLYSLPSGAQSFTIEINSDRWAENPRFWESDYLGREVVIDGEVYLHNRARFVLALE
ncbi:MAG: hypothetical protein LBR85_06020 [Oscillospiraceae bacterium]|nr:hypothetical protein [Oscillospiraceae bacterium]